MLNCLKCLQTKPFSAFHVKKDRARGYQSHCKECAVQTNREFRDKNRDRINIRSRELYREDPNKRVQGVLSARKNHYKNFQDYQKSWRQENPDKVKAHDAVKRASRLKRVPDWLSPAQKEVITTFYWLAQDLETTTGQIYHVDHIVPLLGKTVCGLHVPWNLQILPSDLNLKKNNKFVEDWGV
jgi:hypothetical protein